MTPVFGNIKYSATVIYDKYPSLKVLSQGFSQQIFNNFKYTSFTS